MFKPKGTVLFSLKNSVITAELETLRDKNYLIN